MKVPVILVLLVGILSESAIAQFRDQGFVNARVRTDYNSQTVVADAWINRSAGFLPSGEIDVQAEPWGAIRVDLTSCLEGKVTYRSDLPEFDSGEFPIARLAFSKQIGCVDLE